MPSLANGKKQLSKTHKHIVSLNLFFKKYEHVHVYMHGIISRKP